MKSTIKVGEISVDLECPECGETDFTRSDDTPKAEVVCKSCGWSAGTYADVQADRVKMAKEAGAAAIQTALRKWLKR
jgi:predicted RNA-binding Zn-ribbon protein involved in translation (DUF1610 family)